MEKSVKKHFQLPHIFTICFLLIIIVGALTWFIPSGSFQRQEIETAAGTREVAIAGSYKGVDKVSKDGDLRQGLFDILMAPTKGIQEAADVVAFVLLIGGTFAIINKTNAISAGINRVIRKLKNKDLLIFPIVMILFGIGGTTFGMSEELLPFYAIFMPIILSLGYDSITSFMIVFMGAKLGYCASTINPFNVLISQGLAGIKGNPQLNLRMLWFAIFMVLGIAWVMFYARKVKKDPQKSLTYQIDLQKRKDFMIEETSAAEEMPFTTRQKLVLIIFAVGMATIIWGLITKGWYMDEICAVFLGMGIFSGIAGGLSEKEIAEEFHNGMKDFVYAAVIIGFARGILIVAENGMIIDTILNTLATGLAGVPKALFAVGMYIVYALLSFLVPSSSGMAALTIPIMAPLTELIGLNPEGAVTALQFANETINGVSPTAGILIAALTICNISLSQWLKVFWKFFLLMVGLGILFTVVSSLVPVV